MRKPFFFLISFLSIVLTACDRIGDGPIDPDKPAQVPDTYLSPAIPQGKIMIMGTSGTRTDYLGAGYDVMGSFLDNRSVKSQILDVDKIPEDEISSIRLLGNYGESYEGENAEEFLRSIMKKNDFTMPLENKDDLLFTGTFTGNELFFKNPYDYSTQYTFVAAHGKFEEMRSQLVPMKPAHMMRYLTGHFIEEIEHGTPRSLIELYGTHVLTQVYVGYGIRQLYCPIVATDKEQAILYADEGMTARANTIYKQENVQIGFDKEKADKNFGGAILVEFAGGDFSALPRLQLLPNEVIGDPMNITAWHKSKNPANWTLVTLKGDGLLPIYELIADPVKKQQVKDAVSAHIKENQLKVLQTAPIIQAWSGKHHRYFTSFEEFKEKAGKEYTCEGVIASVFLKPQDKTIPLYLFSDGKNDRLSTAENPKNDNKAMAYKGIFGYVYKEYSGNECNVLYEIWNGQDYAYTSEKKEAYGEKNRWKLTGKEFYTGK